MIDYKKMRWYVSVLLVVVLSATALAISDVSVFQGQYFIGTEFQQGTFDFDFDVYDSDGAVVYSASESLTTGTWGQWRVN